MTEPDLLQLIGLQEELRQHELKEKLNLFETLFSRGGRCYFCAKIVADELYDADIDSVRGYALVCFRAYEHFNNILKEKGKTEAKRVAKIFEIYQFDGWIPEEKRAQINLKIRKDKSKHA